MLYKFSNKLSSLFYVLFILKKLFFISISFKVISESYVVYEFYIFIFSIDILSLNDDSYIIFLFFKLACKNGYIFYAFYKIIAN